MTESMEVAKRRYSEELAAYTLEQWRMARRAVFAAQPNGDSKRTDVPESSSERRTERRRRSGDDDESDSASEAVANMKIHDYAEGAKGKAVNGAGRPNHSP